MKSTKFAIGGDEAKIAAFGGALAESGSSSRASAGRGAASVQKTAEWRAGEGAAAAAGARADEAGEGDGRERAVWDRSGAGAQRGVIGWGGGAATGG